MVTSGLRLSSADLSRFQQLLQATLSPLDYHSIGAWQEHLCIELSALLGADSAISMIPSADGVEFANQGVDPEAYTAFAEYYAALDPGHPRRRAQGLVVCRQADLTTPEEMRSGEFYNGFLAHYRMLDSITLNVDLAPSPMETAWISFYHDRQDERRRFGDRELAMLRLLWPAFNASVGTLRALAGRQADFVRVVDELAAAVVLFDRAGGWLHSNRAADELLEEEPTREELQLAIGGLVQQLARRGELLEAVGVAMGGTAGGVLEEFKTPGAAYRLRATFVGENLAGRPSGGVMVMVERLTPRLPSVRVLQEQFGLTPQESRVAQLVGCDSSTADIARTLGISQHTARRHIERVFLKLHIHSRRELRFFFRPTEDEALG